MEFAGRDVSATGCRLRKRCAYTLVELVVVLGIVALLAVIALPAASRMWQESRLADTENRLRGLLASARMQASVGGERGLFFFVQDGMQRVVFIEPMEPSADPNNPINEQAAADVFVTVGDKVHAFPEPYRVVPLDVVRDANWTPEQIANEDYTDVSHVSNNHVHRNFFTMIFSSDGRLRVGRDAFISDPANPLDAPDTIDNTSALPGQRTGLDVLHVDQRWFDNNGDGTLDLDPVPDGATLPRMISSLPPGQKGAINFPSVDGILVYDDSLIGDYPDDSVDPDEVPDKRRFLIDTGRPFYVSPQTGDVIRGPLGENAS